MHPQRENPSLSYCIGSYSRCHYPAKYCKPSEGLKAIKLTAILESSHYRRVGHFRSHACEPQHKYLNRIVPNPWYIDSFFCSRNTWGMTMTIMNEMLAISKRRLIVTRENPGAKRNWSPEVMEMKLRSAAIRFRCARYR